MEEGSETTKQLVVADPREQAIVRAAPGDVVDAFSEYQKIQQGLDRAMPDCMIEIQGRKFRKKNYWRAIATAFNLTVTLSSEQKVDQDGDWGWIVVYQARARNGRFADGDGSCFATEKRGGQATVHNVRSHAHTRAYNRAVSNLVGFGEVSAEEINEERPTRSTGSTRQTHSGQTITEKQRKRLFAITRVAAERLHAPNDEVDAYVKEKIEEAGFSSSKDLTREAYDALCEHLESMTLNDLLPEQA